MLNKKSLTYTSTKTRKTLRILSQNTSTQHITRTCAHSMCTSRNPQGCSHKRQRLKLCEAVLEPRKADIQTVAGGFWLMRARKKTKKSQFYLVQLFHYHSGCETSKHVLLYLIHAISANQDLFRYISRTYILENLN